MTFNRERIPERIVHAKGSRLRKKTGTSATAKPYERLALERAEFTDLGAEGVAAKIPGFRGLIAVGQTQAVAKRALASALHDWISLPLARGYGLPNIAKYREKSLIGR